MNIEKQKRKTVKKLEKAGERTQMWVIKKSIKGMNKKQLENVIAICLANEKPDEQKEKNEILDTIKALYNKRNWEWIYEY